MIESFLDRRQTSLQIYMRSVYVIIAHELIRDVHSHEAPRLGCCGCYLTVKLLKEVCW